MSFASQAQNVPSVEMHLLVVEFDQMSRTYRDRKISTCVKQQQPEIQRPDRKTTNPTYLAYDKLK